MFVFDNSYSWLHSKQVQYMVEVLDPYGESQDPVNRQMETLSLRDTVEDDRNVREKIDSKNESLVDVPI